MPSQVDLPESLSRLPLHVRIGRFLFGAGLNVLLVILAGILTSFLFPPYEVWWFAWICLIPLFVALRRTTTIRAAGWLTMLFGIAFAAAALGWMRAIFGNSVLGIFALMALPSFLFGLAYRTFAGHAEKWSSRMWAGMAVVVMAAVFWVAVDWIRCEGWYFRFSWMQCGFSFASCQRGGVLYPVIGVYGVTFLIVLANALLAEISLARVSFIKKALGIALCAAFLLPLSLYLNHPIGIPSSPGERTNAFRVEIVQNESGSLPELTAATLRLARYKPDLVVWPEYAVADYPLDQPKLLQKLQDVARTMHCTLILGCKEHAPQNARVDWLRRRGMLMMEGVLFGNIALVIAPDGRILGDYHKTHPIQFFSDGIPGTTYPTFPTPVGRIGIGICYDFDFASCPLHLVRNGAELLVIPTFDSREWSPVQHDQHARMAQARTAEMGRWTVRATSSGVSQIINPSGLVNAAIGNGGTDSAIGIAVARREQTWYVRYGYALPFICLGLSFFWLQRMILLGVRRLLRRKKQTATSVPTPVDIS